MKPMGILTMLLVILVCMLSIYLKLKDIDNFTNPDNFFTNHDAYRYARYAVEIQNSTYGRIDHLADVPDMAVNQYPPPLLSQMTHKIPSYETFKDTMFYKMLVLSEDNFRYFELIYEDYPYMVLYRVR